MCWEICHFLHIFLICVDVSCVFISVWPIPVQFDYIGNTNTHYPRVHAQRSHSHNRFVSLHKTLRCSICVNTFDSSLEQFIRFSQLDFATLPERCVHVSLPWSPWCWLQHLSTFALRNPARNRTLGHIKIFKACVWCVRDDNFRNSPHTSEEGASTHAYYRTRIAHIPMCIDGRVGNYFLSALWYLRTLWTLTCLHVAWTNAVKPKETHCFVCYTFFIAQL